MGTPGWQGPDDVLVEQPNSPLHEVGEKLVITRTYQGAYDVAIASIVYKGTLGSGITAGCIATGSKVQKMRGNIGQLTVTWEAASDESSFVLPPDEVGGDPFEINPKLEKHSRYSGVSDDDREKIRTALLAIDELKRDQNKTGLTGRAEELLKKLSSGFENYYLAGMTYYWTSASFALPALSKGGFIQGPSGPAAGALPAGFTWLRKADTFGFTGSYWKVTRYWLGAPDGHWDNDVYS